MAAQFPVFVGSTFTDLEPYRGAVREALHRLEVVVRGMEYFGSLPDTPKDECLRIVRGCRAYVGIFAMRYGALDPSTGKSFTHLEYDEAQRIGLPSLIYLLDEERQPVLPKFVELGEGAERLRSLKTALRRAHVVSLFTTPDDLASKVTRDLAALAGRNGMEVREGELSRLVATLPRIDWLTDERFAFLKHKIGDVAAPIPSDAVLREVIEFLLSGDNLAAAFLVTRATSLDIRSAIDLLMRIDKRLEAVVRRGYELMTTRDKQTNGELPPAV